MALCGKSIVFLAQAKCPWGLACLDGDLCKQNAHAQFVVKFESLGEKFQGLGIDGPAHDDRSGNVCFA